MYLSRILGYHNQSADSDYQGLEVLLFYKDEVNNKPYIHPSIKKYMYMYLSFPELYVHFTHCNLTLTHGTLKIYK